MKRLPKFLAAVALGTGCTPTTPGPDAGRPDAGPTTDAGNDAGYDAGSSDAGAVQSVTCPPTAPPHDAGVGTPWGDAGCVLPSDFPWDAGFVDAIAEAACSCTSVPFLHCFEENGPRCFSWACPPEQTTDGGYECTADGGLVCLC